MNMDKARDVVTRAVFDPDGTYTLMRLGKDPGLHKSQELKDALRFLGAGLAQVDDIPRDIAFACGALLHFATECRANTDTNASGRQQLEQVSQIAQEAFNVLAGDNVAR